MKLCIKCFMTIPPSIKIHGRAKSLKNRKYCLICSPYKSHNTSQLEKIKEIKKEKTCPKCNTLKSIDSFYNNYCYCKNCSTLYVKKYQKKMKSDCIEYKGGKCIICGYDKCQTSLCFHHLDPTKKDFQISDARIVDFEKIKEELDKCVLLCSNCHGEVHAGITNIHAQAL